MAVSAENFTFNTDDMKMDIGEINCKDWNWFGKLRMGYSD
jgi:hypothetical protein